MIRWIVIGFTLIVLSYGSVGVGLIESFREIILAHEGQINRALNMRQPKEDGDVAGKKTKDEDDEETLGTRWLRSACHILGHDIPGYLHLECPEE